jgi:transglutaminase-like putative cysteine protease
VNNGAARLTPTQFGFTAASMLAAVLPHVARLQGGFALLILGLIGARIVHRFAGGGRIPLLLKLPLVLLMPALVIVHYGNVFGREPGSALACAMLALKLIETETRRDARAAIAFASFVLMSALLFNSGMAFTLMLCLALALFLATLHELEVRPTPAPAQWRAPVVRGLRTAGLSLLAALPLTSCVFLFMPRLGSPLWGAPSDNNTSRTGLGDSMDPSSLQELLIDDSPAFRVSFAGPMPERSKLYWRGPVLTYFDGRTWTRPGYLADRGHPDPLQHVANVVNYEVTLEPSNRHWLLALAVPLSAPDNAARGNDMSLVSLKPVDELLRYRLTSALAYELAGDLGARERARDLALPLGFDPRARALAAQWRSEPGDDDGVIRAALDMFNKQFFYSLAAPETGRNSIDDFLFATRKGFCQHFASSFTFLMRAAGIPARVVTGYQGGYYNGFGDYLVVRQSDAHAWSEVWLAGRGWVRVDPTAAVSPQRVDFGARAAAGASAAWYQAGWLQSLRNRMDLLNRGWNNLVVQFSELRQQSLLTPFGVRKAEYYDLVWALIGSSTLLLAIYSWWVLRRPRERGDDLDAAYARLCRKLERAGARRAANEGPLAYAARLQAFGGEALPAVALMRRYAILRYACELPGSGAVQRFALAVRRLRASRAFANVNKTMPVAVQ